MILERRSKTSDPMERLNAEQVPDALLMAVLRQLPSAVIVFDPEGRIVFANDQVETILGRPLEEFDADWPFAKPLHDEELTITRGDGTPATIRLCSTAIHDDTGAVISFVVTFCDVTEERDGQRRLAERTTRRIDYLQRLTSSLAHAVTVDDVVGSVTSDMRAVLDATVVVFVMLTEDGENARLVGSAGLRPDVEERYRLIPLTKEMPIVEAINSRHPIWISSREEAGARSPIFRDARHDSQSWAAVPLEASGRVLGAIGISFADERAFDDEERRFITGAVGQCSLALERSRLFDSERHAREEAEHASRAKDEFLAILSHELRTPLTSVLGWVDLLRLTRQEDSTLLEQLTALRKAALTQARLIDDLLDVSRIVTGKLRIVKRRAELTECVRGTIDAQRFAAEARGVRLAFDGDGEEIWFSGDTDRMQQIVGNLVANAIKFSRPDGEVRVSVRRDEEHAAIVVADGGEGISAEFLPHVFDRFRQASVGDSRSYSGLGLGLSIVQHLVQLHGGSVKAESDGIGKGATFTVIVPLA